MTDKQLIIDGVDVSALYQDLIACMNRYEVARLFIKTVKQLNQLEGELEQEKALKETYLSCYKAKHEDVIGELFKLKTENCEYIKDLEYLKTIIKDFTQEVVKLKQTLTEIKEMIPPPKGAKLHLVFEQILQKISEVENE